jgi:hypothetical protein
MKTCFKCGIQKPLSDFYKHPQMADGHLNKCKECAKLDAFNRLHGAGRDKVLAYEKKRSQDPVRKAHNRKVAEEWRKANPVRRAAQNAVSNAVRDGRLVPWPVCAMHECSAKPVAHHPDYSRPLDVVWLCQAHHKQAHALVS